ncbi:hypothetical protein [Arcicella lustrica]|uniref:Uncharacterized protein n=1 Tax=Arcicella lustrica TaxID=2984196 RepID=A0ABU5SMU3_9BACT|nr:hypothetical protein [Arcicella sp. DC25W]MEA5428595.1 hypothetical protein [Arcicella sp. DC25W]
MSPLKSFDRYCELKKELSLEIEGFDYSILLSTDLIKLTYRMYDNDYFSLKKIVRQLFKIPNLKEIKKAFLLKNSLITVSANRSDYNELINEIRTFVNDSDFIPLYKIADRLYYNFNLLITFKVFFYFLFSYSKEFNIKERVYLASRALFYRNVLKSLSELFLDFDTTDKKYIAFNSSFDNECLLTEFFNSIGIKTYQLSHGLSYIDYKLFKPFDCITAENIRAKTVLVWGESSKKDLILNYSFSDLRIIVAGNPKYSLKKITVKQTFKCCAVFLARDIYQDGNIMLINILGKLAIDLGIEFHIKLHPLSNKEILSEAISVNRLAFIPIDYTIKEILEDNQYDFAICYNTTVYFEAMYYGLIPFRFGYMENENFKGLDDIFVSQLELQNLMSLFQTKSHSELNKSIETILVQNLGMGINNYHKI